MRFSQAAAFFAKIEAESSRTEITKLLAQLLQEATPAEAQKLTYLVLGELRAPYHGTKFNFAEKSVEAVVAELLGLSAEQVRHKVRAVGDFGAVIAQEGSWKPAGDPTVLDVYHALEEFEQISGAGSNEEKSRGFLALLKVVDPLSACFITRIVIQKLRLGFSEMTLIDAFSWMLVGDKSLRDQIEYAFNVSADIGYIVHQLKEHGQAALKSIDIVVGIPIRPAAAERLPTAEAIMEKLGHSVAQPKFDGFRLQVHLKRVGHSVEISFFSRNLLDMSFMFPELRKAFHECKADRLVVEGEAIAFDVETGTYLPFQETVKRRRKYDIEQFAAEYPLKLNLFDLLYYDGVSYLDKPEKERYDKLQKLFGKYPNPQILVAEQREITKTKELEDYFLQEISAGLEGVMVKRPDASYQAGKRNFNWIKLKRSQHGELEDTIDVVVLGYYSGRGKRASFGIGAALIGIFNEEEDRFETIAKIGTGFSDEGWRDLKKRCDALAVKQSPHNVLVAKELQPDVWVSPELVVLVKADEITRSPVHTAGKIKNEAGYALRFPRFVEYRFDKSATEATSIDEIKRMFEDQRVSKT